MRMRRCPRGYATAGHRFQAGTLYLVTLQVFPRPGRITCSVICRMGPVPAKYRHVSGFWGLRACKTILIPVSDAYSTRGAWVGPGEIRIGPPVALSAHALRRFNRKQE
jgi:hypothetical protein